MDAIVTQEFPGRRDDAGQVETIKVGETIKGDLARVALEQKWAEEVGGAPGRKPGASLDDMNVDALKAFAAEHSIDLGEATRKADIRAAIDAKL